MANTNWNNVISNTLKAAIALALATISGCVVPLSCKTYKVLNNVSAVTANVRNVTNTLEARVMEISREDVAEMAGLLKDLLKSVKTAAEESLPRISSAIERILSQENINKVLEALDDGTFITLAKMFTKSPNLVRGADWLVGKILKPEQCAEIKRAINIEGERRGIKDQIKETSEGTDTADKQKGKWGVFATRFRKFFSKEKPAVSSK